MEHDTPGLGPAGLQWGIKERFVRYIARMGDGRCSVTDGADTCGKNFYFSPGPVQSAADEESVAFLGDVRFSGHHGLLFVRVADPVLVIKGSTAVLSVVDYLDRQAGKRIDLATARITVREDPATLARTLVGTDVRLTGEGTELFNNVYSEGELFDDFEAKVPGQKGPSL